MKFPHRQKLLRELVTMQKESHCNNTNCIQKGGKHICLCPVEGIINTIAKKWALLIIATVGNHEKLRFNPLMEKLGDISPKTLSDRLKELEKDGLIEKKVVTTTPLKVEYSLSQNGIELRDAMIPLLDWAAKKNRN
ncbi:MAG: winged helix-turn-helix transcriptional regulator [Nanoarchaeota archaeon]